MTTKPYQYELVKSDLIETITLMLALAAIAISLAIAFAYGAVAGLVFFATCCTAAAVIMATTLWRTTREFHKQGD